LHSGTIVGNARPLRTGLQSRPVRATMLLRDIGRQAGDRRAVGRLRSL